ncbi:KxYKxGKxW signal peptide domain-containing protein [Ligilactobacillus animalis]|nr:KxYKxGKxW signal peptide domain-containing protein [Ligilactobacillus animalis]MDU1487508.1 KxYKxGKxW signal peptide domain-containing protein [Ligilactobacillus animalis]
MKNIHLKKYTIEEKRRYKLYKRKKTWVVAGITMFSSALLMQMPALADETTTLTLGETTSIHASPEAKPP